MVGLNASTAQYTGRRQVEYTAAVLAMYGTRCWLCGEDGATTADHVIPRSVRPDLAFSLENGRPAHHACNAKRGTKPAPHHDAMALGW